MSCSVPGRPDNLSLVNRLQMSMQFPPTSSLFREEALTGQLQGLGGA